MLHENAQKTPLDIFHMKPVEGEFGIELEIEGTNLPDNARGWVVKPETSLRGEAYEYVIAGAVPFEGIKPRMNFLHEMFKARKSEVKPSERCSTHIHLNMQRKSFRTYFGFVILFTMLEPLILKLCGEARNGNLFCMSSFECGGLAQVLGRQAHALSQAKHIETYWAGRGKYASLNIDPISSLGTVEARCFPLSVDVEDIQKWTMWMKTILEIAESWEDESFASLVDYVYNKPDEIFGRVFPNVHIFSASYPSNPRELAQAGAEIGYELMRAVRPILVWEKGKKVRTELLPKKKKSFFDPFADEEGWTTPQPPVLTING